MLGTLVRSLLVEYSEQTAFVPGFQIEVLRPFRVVLIIVRLTLLSVSRAVGLRSALALFIRTYQKTVSLQCRQTDRPPSQAQVSTAVLTSINRSVHRRQCNSTRRL
jgi:hypothetical protein